jgi:thiol-disulfide isomerase/thioredoxin
VAARDQDILPEGVPAPEFELAGLDGKRVSLRQLLSRARPVILIFASPTCAPCLSLLPHLARWNRVIGNDVTLVVIESTWSGHDLPDEQRAALNGLITLVEPKRRLAEAYGAAATPCAIALTADGLVSSGPMPGSGMVERLIRTVLETHAERGNVDQVATAARSV